MYQHKSISLADQIFERLENDILIGKYSAGEVLTEMALSAELGVSRTPVREALRRLQQEKLVADTSHGITVLGITLDDIRDIYAIRTPIEALAIKGFINNANDEKLKELKDIVELQDFYVKRSDSENVMVRDSEFHEFIYKNCGSHIIEETLLPLHRKIIKYRKASVEHTGRAEKSVNEHLKIYEALANRDEKEATKLIMQHIDNARTSILGGNK
ncbi:MAG: GntR family transcriptional regulator [Clostridiales bacterium]|nr:GntR family transcriptional regulator [Candidatus Equinaster intestinalis]